MKKILSSSLFSLLLLSACEQGLEEEVYDFVAPDQFYRNATDAQVALTSVYDALQPANMYGQYYLIGDMGSDDTFTGEFRGNPDRVQIDEFNVDANNGVVTGRFELSYILINRANAVIDRVPQIDMDTTLRADIVNQARFLRALTYFDLVQLYGDVPLKINETPSDQLSELGSPRVPVEQIYQEVILPDLRAAENLPVTQTDRGRIAQGAAKALLARVHLTRQEWDLARDKAQEVIGLNVYSLFDNYIDAFNLQNENGREQIFSVQYTSAQGEGSSYQVFFQPRGINGAVANGNGVNEPTFDIVNQYEPGDLRFNATYLRDFPLANGTIRTYDPLIDPYIAKYFEATLPIGNLNYPVLRYADVLLMYAEAANEAEGGPSELAYQYINQVRARAGLPGLPAGLSQTDFRARVRQERRVELAFEGLRRYDLVRWGTYLETMRAHFATYYPSLVANVQEHEVLLPIPQREIDLNPAIEQTNQNPGY